MNKRRIRGYSNTNLIRFVKTFYKRRYRRNVKQKLKVFKSNWIDDLRYLEEEELENLGVIKDKGFEPHLPQWKDLHDPWWWD